MYSFCRLFLTFIIYSIMGYIAEQIYLTIDEKRLVLNRGYLIGPWCPVYGVSCICMYPLIKYYSDPIVVYLLGAFGITTIEYLTSVVMEKIFHTRWWDYYKEPFNINGRVCLKNSVLFGFCAMAVVYILSGFYKNLLNYIPKNILIIGTLIIMILFIIDTILSTKIIYKIQKNSQLVTKDMTETIKKKVRKELENGYIFNKRVLDSFPHIYDNFRERARKLKVINFRKKK